MQFFKVFPLVICLVNMYITDTVFLWTQNFCLLWKQHPAEMWRKTPLPFGQIESGGWKHRFLGQTTWVDSCVRVYWLCLSSWTSHSVTLSLSLMIIKCGQQKPPSTCIDSSGISRPQSNPPLWPRVSWPPRPSPSLQQPYWHSEVI